MGAVTLHSTARATVVLAVASLVATAVVWAVTGSAERSAGSQAASRASSSGRTSAAGEATDPVRVLRAWDRRRARAWERGKVRVLRDLYLEGSRTGRRDAAMLQQYVDRGLTVHGLETQLITVEEVRRSADRLVLEVTDRIAGATVVGEEGKTGLPTDRASRRRVELRLVAGRWLVGEVRERSAAD